MPAKNGPSHGSSTIVALTAEELEAFSGLVSPVRLAGKEGKARGPSAGPRHREDRVLEQAAQPKADDDGAT